ncbi:hypothetical protein [Streptomyces sp. NBC_01012]|uniref:hypothetical protein n=1 Tax=Streptomyces sp. NBC_01012 TaxID=2903717 RepID=UPI00386549DD|nr:hypothetical protein OG623_18160 [Streptomyces sp. NBC_01012]
MRKNRVIGFAAAAIVALGLTTGVASAAGAFSGSESGPAKPTENHGSTATDGKDAAMPDGVAVQRTKDGLKVRKLTEEELENMDGAKPTKPLAEDSAADEGKSDK